MSKKDGYIDGYCWCECGEQTKPDKNGNMYRYIYGHQARGKHNSRYGVKLTEEIRQKISLGNVGKAAGEKNPFYGKAHTEEQKQKWSKDRKGRDAGEKNPFYGKHHDDEMKTHLSITSTEYWTTHEHPMKGKPHSEEHRKKNSEAHIGLQVGEKNSFYGKHHTEETKEILRQKSSLQRSKAVVLPTAPERAIHNELNKYGIKFTTETLINDKFCVDIYIPELNLIIYVDGCYWHACPIHCPNVLKNKRDNARLPYLTKCGYNVEIIWEHDIKDNVELVITNICHKYGIII